MILGCVCLTGFARQGAAVAVLAIFVDPMRRDLGWASIVFGAAVSIGGVLAAAVAPWVGKRLDEHGARAVLVFAVVGSGLATLGLSLADSVAVFMLLFCFARMNWAGPFDLGLYGALNAWFVANRARAASIATVAQLAGLVVFPLVAHAAIEANDWRGGWIAVGTTVLVVGLLPVSLLLVRRPEDLGISVESPPTAGTRAPPERQFSRQEALRTRAFWLLAAYTVLLFPCQAGVSLYQASHLVERGVDAGAAALVVSTFSFMSALASLAMGWRPHAWPVRYALAACGALMCAGATGLLFAGGIVQGALGAVCFGLGVGGMLAAIPVVWADYFGRDSYGAIRGIALSMQVLAQACGPLAAGALRDATGAHTASLALFATLSGAAVLVALAARRPPGE